MYRLALILGLAACGAEPAAMSPDAGVPWWEPPRLTECTCVAAGLGGMICAEPCDDGGSCYVESCPDAGPELDAGPEPDGGVELDSGSPPVDSGQPDGGPDSGPLVDPPGTCNYTAARVRDGIGAGLTADGCLEIDFGRYSTIQKRVVYRRVPTACGTAGPAGMTVLDVYFDGAPGVPLTSSTSDPAWREAEVGATGARFFRVCQAGGMYVEIDYMGE